MALRTTWLGRSGILFEADGLVDFALAVGACLLVPLHHDGVVGDTVDSAEIARAARGPPAPTRALRLLPSSRP